MSPLSAIADGSRGPSDTVGPLRSGDQVYLGGTYRNLITGEPVDLASGDDRLLLHFWATYCAPCVEDIPEMNRLRHEVDVREDLLLVTVLSDPAFGVGMNLSEAREFLSSRDVEYLVIYDDEQASLTERFQIRAVPWTFLVDPQGRILLDKMTEGSDSEVFTAALEHEPEED